MKSNFLVKSLARQFSSSGAFNPLKSGMPQMPNMTKLKRFYKNVDVIEHPASAGLAKIPSGEAISLNNLSMSHDKYYAVTLDGRVVKTFYKDVMAMPSRALAVAVAEEWESQHEKIDVRHMHLTTTLTRGIRV